MIAGASFFSGIGGMDLGFERAGVQIVAQVEKDAHRRRLLHKHWPDIEQWADINDVWPADLPFFDLAFGGFPCKDLSISRQNRSGLAGNQSGLLWSFLGIVEDCKPRWVVLENVVGLLSSNRGRDMGALVGALAECGYGWAYRVLDSQHFGVAQQRRRVFVVGCLGERRSAARVLFESSGSFWNAPARRPKGKPYSLHVDGGVTYGVPKIASTLMAEFGRNHTSQGTWIVEGDEVRKLTIRERERVQGFPEGWTSMFSRDRAAIALGDAVTVPVAEWIGRRLIQVHEETRCD